MSENKGGRPAIEFTDEQINQIEKLAAVLTQEQIGDFLGISDRTLRRKMQDDERVLSAYKRGRSQAVGMAGGKLLELVRKGNIAAICFFLKTQAGWRETNRTELTGVDGNPIQTAHEQIVIYVPANGREVKQIGASTGTDVE